ncbi:MAG: PorT family protein [Muribaculaceae bacterium]|nr:PorT family protein [Muribaculaceae bacterium]
MKKLFFCLIAVLTALSASAEFRWGPTAGLNINNYYWKQPLLKSDYRCGVNAGILGELMIPGIGFGVDMGLMYNMHSGSVDLGSHPVWSNDGYTDTDITLHTVQIPVHLRFKWTRMNGVEQYIAPFAYVGPAFCFTAAQSKCAAIEHPAGNVGLQFGLGAEIIEHIQFSVCYQWGVSYELRTVKLDNLSARGSSWNINIAYLF